MLYCANCGKQASVHTDSGYMAPLRVSTTISGRVVVCSPNCGDTVIRMSTGEPSPPPEGMIDLAGFAGDPPPMGDGHLGDLQFEDLTPQVGYSI